MPESSQRRLADIDHKVEKTHDRLHSLGNVVTSIKLQTDLLEADHNHVKKELWRGLSELREISKSQADAIQAQILASHEANLQAQQLSDRHASTERILRWILGLVSVVAGGTTIAFLTRSIGQTNI